MNALPALGVLLALALTLLALRRAGAGEAAPRTAGDALRLAVAAVLLVLGLPWLLADLGVYIGDVPGLGAWFVSKELLPGETLPAVHLGHHHGLDGLLFTFAALALTRALRQIGRPVWRALLAAYVGLMLVYGLANAVQDFWLEQVVKRGWAADELPSVLRPALTPAWGLLLLAAVGVWLGLLRAARGQAAPLPGAAGYPGGWPAPVAARSAGRTKR